jgi:NAD(P)-dependent dehydrogenase (short-subunit alcohol dehydrogenase family)
MALSLAQRGWDLVITYRERADQADTLRQEVEALGGRLVALALDVGQAGQFPGFAAQVEAALQAQWGGRRLQALVNNAGVGIYAPLAELTEAQFDALVAIHLKGPFFLTQALLPLLADGGRIVNISSGLTRFSLPGYGAYASMKGAIEVFTRYLAKELGARGIAVNTVAPGAIETDFGGRGARPAGGQGLHRLADRPGPCRRAGGHRPDGGQPAVARSALGQCPAHRGVGRHVL